MKQEDKQEQGEDAELTKMCMTLNNAFDESTPVRSKEDSEDGKNEEIMGRREDDKINKK